jgi:2-methylcitrate dehydratase PrpD
MSATNELIAFVRNLDYNHLPGGVISQTKRCVLDLLGGAIAGSQTSMARISTGFAHNQFGAGRATLIGSPLRLSEVGATWVNGVCASALDLDDGHRRAAGHPGAAVIPTALAVAETAGASGRDFLAAIVAGYEIAVRVSIAMLPDYRRGRYSTGIWGGFGSVAAAASVLNLDKRTFQDALGIVGFHRPSPAGGAFMHESMVKETIGWAGMVGCVSAFLAREGFTGPEDVLDKSGHFDTAELVEGLGQDYAILRIYFKPYASCRWSHPAIDGALRLFRDEDLRLDDIREIHLEAFQPITMLCDYTPVTTVAAQYSVPMSVALALVYGRIGPSELTEANLQDPEILDLAQRVRVSVDPELDRMFPDKTAIRVTLRTSRGHFDTMVKSPKGDPENPMSDEELAEKFHWLTDGVLREERSQELKKAIDHLEQLENVRQLTELLAFEVN